MKALLLAIAIFIYPVSLASAQSVMIGWPTWGNPAILDNCPGNCGGGCGDWPNVCGGDHYWTVDMLGQPFDTGFEWYENICPTGTYLWRIHIVQRAVWSRFTYHGVTSWGCQTHDSICRSNWDLFIGCWLTAEIGLVCADVYPTTYGPYEDYNVGFFIADHQVLWGEPCVIQ